MPYASLANIKSILHLGISDYSEDLALQFLALRVDHGINEYCKRDFTYGQTEEIYTVHGPIICVLRLPIESIESVSIDGESLTTDQYKIISKGIVLKTKEYTIGSSVVDITYTGGFQTLPTVIDVAATLQLAHEYQRHGHIGASSVSNDGGSVNYPELSLLKEVKNMLSRFRNGYKASPIG